MQLNDVVMEVADESDPPCEGCHAPGSNVPAGFRFLERPERPLEAAISGAVAGERVMVSDPAAVGISECAQALQTTLANLHHKHDSLEKRLDEWITSIMEQQQRIQIGIEEIGATVSRPPAGSRASCREAAHHWFRRAKTPDMSNGGFSNGSAGGDVDAVSGVFAMNGSAAQVENANLGFDRQESFAAKLESVVKHGAPDAAKPKRMSTVLGKSMTKALAKEEICRTSQGSERNLAASRLKLIVQDPAFDTLCACVIIVYTVLLGFSVEQSRMARGLVAIEVMGLDNVVGAVSYACNLFFFIELLLRMKVAGCRKHFTGEDRNWNIFDFSLVLLSVMDLIGVMLTFTDRSSASNEDTGRLLSAIKILKMMRIVRTFRMFRFFRELALLTLMITDSLKSLMWAIIMLIIITYVFAIVFTQVTYDRMSDAVAPQDSDALHHFFGTLPSSIYSLIQAMLGGINWGLVCNVLLGIGSADSFVMVALFLFYIAFTTLAVLNIITGVFVDNAMENTKTQREFLIQAQMEAREKHLRQLRDIFIAMDDDGDFVLTCQELENSLHDEKVRTHFQALDLDPSDMKRLFGLLDEDSSGEVFLEEFLDGCLRLKGSARSIDVHAILWECKRMSAKIEMLSLGPAPPHNGRHYAVENGCHHC